MGEDAEDEDAARLLRVSVDDNVDDDDGEVLDEGSDAVKADADKFDARGRAPRVPAADAASSAAQKAKKARVNDGLYGCRCGGRSRGRGRLRPSADDLSIPRDAG